MTLDKVTKAIEASETVTEAAIKLGITRQHLHLWLKKHNLKAVVRDHRLKVVQG